MKKALINNLGEIVGLFDTGRNKNIPEEAIEIPESDYQAHIAGDKRYHKNGTFKKKPDQPDFGVWDGDKYVVDVNQEKKAKKKDAEPILLGAIARLVLGQPVTQDDIDAANDYLA